MLSILPLPAATVAEEQPIQYRFGGCRSMSSFTRSRARLSGEFEDFRRRTSERDRMGATAGNAAAMSRANKSLLQRRLRNGLA
ncbi:hypothetical protein FE789_29780 [Burkholderia pseudomallei]|nr:hypothetical protein FE789_29780 [Burkholderia pseudomallei]